MINTHEKLVETILQKAMSKEQLYEMLARKGYKGTKDSMIVDLLYATVASDKYMLGDSLAEDEYWKALIEEMNLNY